MHRRSFLYPRNVNEINYLRKFLLALSVLIGLATLPGCQKGPRYNQGICTIGSEQLNTALNHWATAYQKKQIASGQTKARRIIHEGRGTAVAPNALLKRICDMAIMSRPMQDAEINAFVEDSGTRPVALAIALEALAIIVNRKAPPQAIGLEGIVLAFGKTPDKLSQVFAHHNPTGGWYEHKPQPYGINSATDRYRWLRHEIMKGHYSDRVLELSQPEDVVKKVAEDLYGMGYVRPAEATQNNNIKMLDFYSGGTAPYTAAPDRGSIQSGRYPLTRYHYIYLPPIGSQPAVHRDSLDYIEYILSAEGQAILSTLGLYKLNQQDLAKNAAALQEYRQASQGID